MLNKQFIGAICLFSFFLSFSVSDAQNRNNLREKRILLSTDSIKIDTLSILPDYFLVYTSKNEIIPSEKYQINYFKSYILFDSTFFNENSNQIIIFKYRVFTNSLSYFYYHKDTSIIVNKLYKRNEALNNFIAKNDLDNESQLKKDGILSRGVGLGNQQELVFNSEFNLQLSGKIHSDINIIASISETNVPFQPEGNTQQLQEFDKMFIQLFTDKKKLTFGDFELTSPLGNYLKMNKKVKGSQFFTIDSTKNKFLKTINSLSLSKGNYHRVKLFTNENNQGPYRLYGINNELFIIVLSGSEKVYLNGKLLNRGTDFDYIIDYNKAEIIFTNQISITKDSRVIVEYEYSERNYVRFNLSSSTELKTSKLHFGFNFYSETDAKNQTITSELTENEITILQEIGNNIDDAFIENRSLVEFTSDLILYKEKDTIVNEILYQSILEHITTYHENSYQVGFTYVGENKGNYVSENSLTNGKVYKWKAPINGKLQGNYEPIKQLVTPKKKELYNIWFHKNISQKWKTKVEIAVSNSDKNTFSNLDDSKNKAFAFKTEIFFASKPILPKNLNIDSTNQKKFLFYQSSLQYERIQAQFTGIENFKEVEHSRIWNLTDEISGTEDKISYFFEYFKNNNIKLSFTSDFFKIDTFYKAFKNQLIFEKKIKQSKLKLQNNYLFNTTNKLTSNYLTSLNSYEIYLKKITLGTEQNIEWKQSVLKQNSILAADAFSFYEFSIYGKRSQKLKNQWLLSYKIRQDFLPFQNKLIKNSTSYDFINGIKLQKGKTHQLKINLVYRKLLLNDSLDINLKPENNLKLQIDYLLKIPKDFIITNIYYENFSGLELQKEIAYIEVENGQGNYVWNDYNANNQKEIDEFELTNFQYDAKYVRVWLPSNTYSKVYGNQFNLSVKIEPHRILKNKSFLYKTIGKISNQLLLNIHQKTDDLIFQPVLQLNDFYFQLKDYDFKLQNTLFLNKLSRVFNTNYTFKNYKNLTFLANGIDFSQQKINTINSQWFIFQTFILKNELQFSEKTFTSEYGTTRNYKIQSIENKSIIEFKTGKKLKFEFAYSYKEKQNIIATEQSRENKVAVITNYMIVNKSNFNFSLDWVALKLNTDAVNSITYNMLDGLQKGKNWIWNITYLQNINKTLQLNITYSGRQNSNEKIIHNGYVQLKALF